MKKKRQPTCPACRGDRIDLFYRLREVPVNSVLLLGTEREAKSFTRAPLQLGYCRECGFIHNTHYDEMLTEYSPRCEETQGFSATFRTWQQHLARDLIERHGLTKKHIVEVGCGKGEFLRALCELGDNTGVGYDPAYVAGRDGETDDGRVKFVQDFYRADTTAKDADFLCCKMTLEHIPDVADFVSIVRTSLGHHSTATVFFQVPDMERILEELAFWDVYYEHCSYFTAGSLRRLFTRCGFEVMSVRQDYGGQYLMLEAVPARAPHLIGSDTSDLQKLAPLVVLFAEEAPKEVEGWRRRLLERSSIGQKTVIWGSGSKGVAFLTTVGLMDEVDAVVDVNPHRWNHHMPGTGHRIVSPDELVELTPDLVVVMNPVYRDEVRRDLRRIGLQPEVMSL